MKLVLGFLLIFIAQAVSFIQLQGQMKWEFAKNNPFLLSLLGVPIGYIFIYTTKLFNEHFAFNWPGRLIGQAVGIIVFSLMSWILFNETISMKTAVCIVLALLIVIIQIFWK